MEDRAPLNVIVLGTGGMLGHMVYKVLTEKGHNVYGTQRSIVPTDNRIFELDADGHWHEPLLFLLRYFKIDYIINCIGIIKPHIFNNKASSIYVNSLFPRELTAQAGFNHVKVIHITTDCVFSGKPDRVPFNYYNEGDRHDITDLYGRSKSLGEPEDALSIRTSIIGPEIHNKVSLLEWFKAQKGKSVTGYTNHYWNGLTTKQLALAIDQILRDNMWVKGVRHVYMPTVVTKHQMLVEFENKYQLGIKVVAVEDNIKVDRTLGTAYRDFVDRLNIPSFTEMLADL